MHASFHSRPRPLTPQSEAALRRLTAAGIVLLALNLRIAVAEVPPVLRDLLLTDFERSLLVAIPAICFGLAAFAGPPLSARLGEERVLLAMCAALCASLALRPWWPNLSLFVGTILCGLAVAVMNVMMPSVLRRRFPKQLGLMTAAYTTALSVGASVAAGFTVPLVNAVGGSVPLALAIWAVPAGVAFAVWLPQIRMPLPGARTAAGDIGLLRDLRAWQITLFFGLQSALYYSLLSWLPTIYRDHGASPVAAGAVLAVLSAMGIAGNFSAPLLAQRSDNAPAVVVGCSVLILIGLGGVLFAPTTVPLAWAILLGIGTAGSFSLTLLLMASRAKDEVIARRLSSMAQGIGYMISALGPLLAGFLHSISGGWTLAIVAMIGICGAQLGVGLLAARPQVVSR